MTATPQLQALDTEAAAEYIHMAPATLRYWRHAGVGPAYFKIGPGKTFYRVEDLQDWLNGQYKTSVTTAH